MSSAFSNRRLAPQNGSDILFCHSCGHEWYRSSDDTSPPSACPRCEQVIVEIVSRENDPRTFQQTTNSMLPDTLFNLGGLGSAGPSARMPSLQRRQQRDQSSSYLDDDDDSFGNRYHDHMHRSLHRSMHNGARERSIRAHHEALHGIHGIHGVHGIHGGHDENDGHGHSSNFDSDPEEADIDEQEFRAPNNLFVRRTVVSNITTTSNSRRPSQANQPQPGSGASQRPGATDPSDADSLVRTFMHIINGFHDSQAGRSGTDTLYSRRNNSPFREYGASRQRGGGPSTSFGSTSFTIATGPIRTGQPGETADFNTVLGSILGHVGPPDIEEQNPQAAGTLPPGFPAALHNIILAVLSTNRNANFQAGDAVHSDEALDRIITMMMESSQQSSGAPPASQNALDELEKKKVDQSMLGSEGHAECTICISEVALNDEVLQLPCKHWFHEDCVVMWLKQHNTCPVCRHAVVGNNEGGNADQASQSAGASGPAAGGRSSTPGVGGSQTNSGNGGGGDSRGVNPLFGGVLSNLPLPRLLFGNMNGPGNLPSAAATWGPGTPDAAGSSTNANASNTASNSSASSSSAAPTPFISTLRQRMPQRPQDVINQQERLNAIRGAAGLAPSPSPNTTDASAYRSPRAGSWTERERRRRDSHSPNRVPNMPSRRYNPFMADLDDWQQPEHPSPSRSSTWNTAPQSSSRRNSLWGGNGPSANYSSTGLGRGPVPDSDRGSDTGRNAEPSSRSWRRSSLLFGSGGGSGHDNDSVGGGMDVPSFSRTNSRLSRMSDDPAPTATNTNAARASAARMSSLMSSHSTDVGGDGHGDVYMHDEARGGEAGSNSSRSSNNNGGGNGSGGSRLFGLFRRR